MPPRKYLTADELQLVAYGCCSIGIALLNSIFSLYYAPFFLQELKLHLNWYYGGQILYALWNSVNDPVFGYVQDNTRGARRSPALRVGGPLLALCFIMVWMPISTTKLPFTVGIHFILAICLYDAAFTWTAIAQCALFAELRLSPVKDRSSIQKAGGIGTIIGSLPMFISYSLYDPQNLFNFRVFTIVVGVIAAALIWFAGVMIKENISIEDHGAKEKVYNPPLKEFLRQILWERNFVVFIVMNFLQICTTSINDSFYILFSDVLIGREAFHPSIESFILGTTQIAPSLCGYFLASLVVKEGSHLVIKYLLFIKLCSGLLMYVFFSADSSPSITLFYLFFSRVLGSGTFTLFNFVIADIVDEDTVTHSRERPATGMFFAVNALFTKPAASIAPSIVVAILAENGGGSSVSNAPPAVVFSVASLAPVLFAVAQLSIWSQYTLRSQRLQQVHSALVHLKQKAFETSLTSVNRSRSLSPTDDGFEEQKLL